MLSQGSGGSAAGVATPAAPADAPAAYWRFYEEVAAAQLAAWAPATPSRVLDLSGGRERFAAQLVAAGHEVVHVCETPSRVAVEPDAAGRLLTVVADPRSLGWLADESVDAVLAESRALSTCLATEVTAADLLRALRPGGRLMLVVDSLNAGLASLAEQGRWAELADVPAADVVLVPGPGDVITRVFWPVELAGLLTAVGFEVEWVRSRTLLATATVERALAQGGSAALAQLVQTELELAVEREGEAGGLHLVASARRPAGRD